MIAQSTTTVTEHVVRFEFTSHQIWFGVFFLIILAICRDVTVKCKDK